MKNSERRGRTTARVNALILVGGFAAFFLAAAVFAAPMFTARSSSLSTKNFSVPAPPAIDSTQVRQVTANQDMLSAVPVLPPGPEMLKTYASDCTTPQTAFFVGDTVCVVASGVPVDNTFPRYMSWAAPDSTIVRQTQITSDPQSDSLLITATSDVNGRTIDNRGNWTVVVRNPFFFFPEASTSFTVSDRTNPTADIGVFKSAASNTVASGSDASFDIQVNNYGPDASVNIQLVDPTPDNTTFVSFQQTSGPAFVCLTQSGTTICSIAALSAGDVATFRAIYTVTAQSGSQVSNSVNILSTTSDQNSANNSSTATVTVSGTSNGSCTLTCPSDITTPANTTDQDGNPGAVVHFDPPTGEGTCGTITTNHCNDCFFPVGTTTVTSGADSGDACSFDVTVTPEGAPTITCPPDKDVNTTPDNTDCEAAVDPGTPTTTGNDVTVSGSRSDGRPLTDRYPAGTTTITWTATAHDSNGDPSGTATCQQRIVVHDKTPPAITCPSNVTVTSPTGSCSATVNVGVPTATDNCDGAVTPVPSRSDNKPITDPFPVGTVTITWTATDSSGNSASCSQSVIVLDNEPPTITCPANITANTDPGQCSATVNPGTATATDNCTAVTVSGTRSDGQALNAPYPKGTTTITWTARDASGNTSSCTQTVTVVDNQPPNITCPAPSSASADANCQAAVPDMRSSATTSDNCGSVTVTQSPAPGTTVGLGPHAITLTATDSSGNSSSCTTTFTVNDTTPPTITFKAGQTLWPPNHKYTTFAIADFVSSVHDNCSGNIAISNVVITKVTSDEAENGSGSGNTLNDIVIASDCKSVQLRAEREGDGNGRVYTVFFSVRDAAGNVGTGTTKVVVPHNPGETAVDSGPHYIVTSNCP